MQAIVVWGVTALLAGVLGSVLAHWKNRDWNFWTAWCFLVPPVLILLAILPKRVGPTPRTPTLDQIDRHEDRIGLGQQAGCRHPLQDQKQIIAQPAAARSSNIAVPR